MIHEIVIKVEDDSLGCFTDEYLASLWHVAQINPKPIRDSDAGALAERVGREIIRRFCLRVGPPLWEHQGRHAPDMALADMRTKAAKAAMETEQCCSK